MGTLFLAKLLAYLTRGRLWFLGILSAIIGAGFLLGVLFWGGLHSVLAYTDRLEFCISCHEMRAGPFAEYENTPHFRNASGVRAVCADCHVPREWWPRMVRKFQAAGELYGHFTGAIDTPEKYEAHRLAMARRVWTSMAANDSRECRNCHSFEAMDPHRQRPAAVAGMEASVRGQSTCVDCHRGIAHRLPDMSRSLALAFATLQADALREGARAETLYSIATKPLFLDRPDGAAEGNGDGRLLGGAEVRVLERRGDWLRVRIEGWQQEGAERAIYALRGHRILTAALGSEAIERLEVRDTAPDPETDLVWSRVALEAWTAREGLLADRARLASYAGQLYGDACGTCHAAHAPDSHLANQWIGTMNAMRERSSLDDEQYRFLLRHLQLNARDTGGRS